MLEDLLKDHLLYHSEFQQDNFITGRAGTLYGQYKQSLRETHKRYRGLKDIYCDREKLVIEIDEQKYLSKKIFINKFEKKKAKVEYKRKFMSLEEIDKNIEETEREFTRFYQQSEMLREQIGELTPEKRRELEKELWVHKTKEMMVTDWVCNGRFQPQTHEMLLSLPIEMRIELIKQTTDEKNQKETIQEIMNEDKNHFQEFKNIKLDVKCLLGQ